MTDRATIPEVSVSDLLDRAESLVGAGTGPDTLARALLAELSRAVDGGYVAAWQLRTTEAAELWAEAGRLAHRPTDDEFAAAALGQLTRVHSEAVAAESTALIGSELISGASLVLQVMNRSEAVSRQCLVELADVLAELRRRALLSQTIGRSDRFGDVMRLTTALHDDLNARRVLRVFATDAAAVLGATRLFIGRRRGWTGWSVEAATGVTQVNPRADDVRFAVSQFKSAAKLGDGSDEHELAQDAAKPGDGVGDDRVGYDRVVPVSESGTWKRAQHALLIESEREVDSQTLELLRHHLYTALENSRLATEATLVGRLVRLPQALFRPSSIGTIAVVAACTAWLWFGTAELTLEVYGEARPMVQRSIFAPEDGVLTEMKFASEDVIAADETLCTLENDSLEIERERLNGELATSVARLTALDTRRGTTDRTEAAAVSAQREEVRIRIASIESQLDLLERQMESLRVVAPLSGQLSIEGLPAEWEGRPVRRGQRLATVSDTEGAWEIRLRIPERDIRHVLATQAPDGSWPEVSFVLETAVEQRIESRLTELEATTRVDEFGELSTIASARLPLDLVGGVPRPGAGVIATIHCGEERAGFVYLRRVIEAIQRYQWF